MGSKLHLHFLLRLFGSKYLCLEKSDVVPQAEDGERTVVPSKPKCAAPLIPPFNYSAAPENEFKCSFKALFVRWAFSAVFVPFPQRLAWQSGQSCLGLQPPPSQCSKKAAQLQRKQMGAWNLFSTHLIKRQGRSWMRWPLISHLFLCLTERQSLSKGLEKSFHSKEKVAQKWWREVKRPISSCWRTRVTHGEV